MPARLYAMSISHPAKAARLLLEHKGIEYEAVEVAPGTQAVRVRLAGFRGGTVPALRIDGRRVVGTCAISRTLEELHPEPPLFPRDPQARRAVEEAEEWGERVLQPVPRRLFRWAIRNRHEARVAFGAMMRMPMPRVTSSLIVPVAAFYARREEANSTERIRADLAALPDHLDHVDELIARGTIGGEELNAADYQIGTTLRHMLAFEDFSSALAGRPAEALGQRIWPDHRFRVPALLPANMR